MGILPIPQNIWRKGPEDIYFYPSEVTLDTKVLILPLVFSIILHFSRDFVDTTFIFSDFVDNSHFR